MLRIVSDDSYGPSVHPAEPGDDVLRVERHHLEEFALVDDACDALEKRLLGAKKSLNTRQNNLKLKCNSGNAIIGKSYVCVLVRCVNQICTLYNHRFIKVIT